MNEILSTTDLEELTGYKSPDKQAEVLITMGVGFGRGRFGHIKTTWQAVNHALIGEQNGTKVVGPNLEHL